MSVTSTDELESILHANELGHRHMLKKTVLVIGEVAEANITSEKER